MRLIDADALIAYFNKEGDKGRRLYDAIDIFEIIDTAPTIEAERAISETIALRADEFAEEMREALQRYGDDEEIVHNIGDGLMCDLLRELGYGKGVDIFEDMPKWYA